MENKETTNVAAAQADVIDYTNQLILEPGVETPNNKFCVMSGNTVTINFTAKLKMPYGNLIKIASLPNEVALGSNRTLTFAVYTMPGATQEIHGYIVGNSLNMSAASLDSNIWYRFSVTYVKP